MAAAEPSVYFHIGLHKTGTTYVQNVLRANRQNLRDQRVLYPGGEGFPVQVFAVWDLLGRRPKGSSDARSIRRRRGGIRVKAGIAQRPNSIAVGV